MLLLPIVCVMSKLGILGKQTHYVKWSYFNHP
jgi:hypothetical protein